MTLFDQIMMSSMPMVGYTIVTAVVFPLLVFGVFMIWQRIDQRKLNEIIREINDE